VAIQGDWRGSGSLPASLTRAVAMTKPISHYGRRFDLSKRRRMFCYSVDFFSAALAFSFSMSAGESCGRSIFSVILLILPVKLKGGW
jgi:hypothetical protein